MSAGGIVAVMDGYVRGEPESRYTADGKLTLTFKMPQETFMGKGRESLTTWWRVTLWEDDAERLAPYIKNGTWVTVTGEPYIREYESNGNKGSSPEIKYPRVRLGPKLPGNGDDTTAPERATRPQPQRATATAGRGRSAPAQEEISLDDMPWGE